MFHCSSLSSLGGVPRAAPLGHGPAGPPRPAPAPAGGGGLRAHPPRGRTPPRRARAPAGRGGFGAIQPRYCTPPLMLPVPFISILSSKSAASPPFHTR